MINKNKADEGVESDAVARQGEQVCLSGALKEERAAEE